VSNVSVIHGNVWIRKTETFVSEIPVSHDSECNVQKLYYIFFCKTVRCIALLGGTSFLEGKNFAKYLDVRNLKQVGSKKKFRCLYRSFTVMIVKLRRLR
jgi:hypothetical protein